MKRPQQSCPCGEEENAKPVVVKCFIILIDASRKIVLSELQLPQYLFVFITICDNCGTLVAVIMFSLFIVLSLLFVAVFLGIGGIVANALYLVLCSTVFCKTRMLRHSCFRLLCRVGSDCCDIYGYNQQPLGTSTPSGLTSCILQTCSQCDVLAISFIGTKEASKWACIFRMLLEEVLEVVDAKKRLPLGIPCP